MSQLLSRYNVRWIIVGLIVISGAFASLWFINSLREKAKVPQVIERIHMITKMLEVYVADNGKFPEDLQSLITEMRSDQGLLSSIAGEKVEYLRPTMSAPGTTTVMVVTLGTSRIEINKNFERQEKP